MTEMIAYFLYTDGEPEEKRLMNDRFWISIFKCNPNQSHSPLLGTRFSTVYCDAEFTKTAAGRDFINECIKPCACIGKQEFYLI